MPETKKIKPMPVLLFGREYWEKTINFRGMVEEGVIAPGGPPETTAARR